jgi:uncharacterized HAD superfamily protein
MKIGIDIDDTICEALDGLAAWAKTKYGLSFGKEDITTYGGPTFEGKRLANLFDECYSDPEVVEALRPVPGAISGVRNLLRRGHRIVFLTARPDFTRDATIRWLSRTIGHTEVEFVARGTPKAIHNVHLLIDDHFLHIDSVVRLGGIGIIYTQPWNRKAKTTEDPSRVFRADGWQDVLEVVGNIEATQAFTRGPW